MTSRDTKHSAEICMKTKENTKPQEISAMERYKRLVQFFSNPDRTLKDLYPISTYSASETTLDYEEHDRVSALYKDDRTSGSDFSLSHVSSHTRFSRTFGLEDPPSRLELKRRPRRAPPEQTNSGTNAQATNSRSGLTNHTKAPQHVKPTDSEKRCLILTSADICTAKPQSLRSSDSGDNNLPRGPHERTRKRRRSPDNSKGSGISQHRETIIVNRRKSSSAKQFEENTSPLLSSDFILTSTNRSRVRSPQRPHSSPASNQTTLAQSSSHSSNKSHSPAESALAFANRLIAQSNSFSSRPSQKSQESPRSSTKSRNDTQSKSRHESVSPKSRVESPARAPTKHHESQTRSSPDAPSRNRASSKSHGSLPRPSPRSHNSQSPTRSRLNTVSSPDTAYKLTKAPKNIEGPFMPQEKKMEEGKTKQPHLRKTKKFRKEASNKNIRYTDEEVSRSSLKNDQQETQQKHNSLKSENVLQESKSSEINTSQSMQSESIEVNSQPFKIANTIYSPIRTSIINTCLGTDNKPIISTLTNKDVACLLERSPEKQKWTVKSTSSWRSTGSDSTEAESLLDLDKFKQAILSVEMPSEYLEPPQETEIGENIFSVLETISESPLEECAMIQGTKEMEDEVVLRKTTSWVNTQTKRKSEQTLSGSEDLSDIQLHYVYGRKSPKDQFQLEWIKLEKVGEDGDAASSAKADSQFRREKIEDENKHVCSLSLPSTNKAPRVGDADVAQLATFITLPTQSPQSGEDSVVDIIVLREENLTEEQKSAIKRYRSGLIRKNRRKDSSCDASQRSGDPIVIPLSEPETNVNSASGYAVLADWPELPLSVDVDVKSWLSKSESEETESVIYVNRCVSKRSQSTSVWASQTLLGNRSEGNFSEAGEWSVADEANQTASFEASNKRKMEKALSEKTSGKGNQSKNRPSSADNYENHGANRGKSVLDNSASTESVSTRDTSGFRRHLERPKTAPPSGQGMAGLEEIHLLSRKLRSKSSNSGTKSILKRRRHSSKKPLDEQEEVTENAKCSGKIERSFSDLSETVKLTIRQRSNSEDLASADNRDRPSTAPSSKHRRSPIPEDDDILVLFKPKTWQQRGPKEADRYVTSRGAANKVIASIKKQSRDASGGSDRISQVSGSSAQSEKTTASKKSKKTRPRTLSPNRLRKEGEIQLALDSSKDLEQFLRKLNIKRGRPSNKTKDAEKQVSKGTQKDRAKSHQVRQNREEQSPLDQRRKTSRERSQTPQHETVTSRFRTERRGGTAESVSLHEFQSDFSVEPSVVESENSELKRKSEKSPPHLTAYLKTISNLRQKCCRKDCIIGALLEQLTSLPLSDAARKRILDMMSVRLKDGSKPHRDYSTSDILELLEMKLGSMVFPEDEKESESEEKLIAEIEVEEKKEPKEECVCPRDFKIAGSVGCDCLLLTWKSSPRIGEIAGYKVDVDGQLRQHVRSAARTSALLMDLDLSRRMQLALRTQLRAGGEPSCHPPLEIAYEPAPEEDPTTAGKAQHDCSR